MSVVGIDIGDDTCKVAVARRAGIDVLQNEVGKRKTESMVSYTSGQRLLGSEAPPTYASNFANTAVYMKRILGKSVDDAEFKNEVSFIPVNIVADKNNKAVYEVSNGGKKEQFSPEQVMATLLGKIRSIAELNLDGIKVKDCVIAVPHFFTDAQRQAMLDAAQIAGLNVLRLMNESTAVALQYGMTKGIPETETRKVLFYDIGHTGTSCALVTFTGSSKMQINGVGFDRNLGGRDIDEMLVAHFAKMIQTKYKMDVYTNMKAMIKMRKECNRIKHLLSAGPQCQFNIEYLMDGKDATGLITRKEFDDMVTEQFGERLVAPIKTALGDTDISAVHSVEIIGGTSRVPIVQQILKNAVGRDLSKTCDSDESIARGATLQCAMISPSIKTKDYQFQDVYPYAIDVAFKNNDAKAAAAEGKEMQTQNIFTVNNPIPSVKMMTFKDWNLPVELVATYPQQPALGGGQERTIAKFSVSGGPAGKIAERIKVRLALDANGVMSVQSAQILEEYEVEEPAPAADAAATAAAAAPAAAAAAPAAGADGAASPAPAAGAASSAMDVDPPASEAASPTNVAADASAAAGAAPAAPAAPGMVKKKKVRRTDLSVSGASLLALSSEDIRKAQNRELDLAHKDRQIQQTLESRNNFEAYTLDMRSRLGDDLKSFVRPADADKFTAKLREAEAWLEDHEEEEKKVYDEKLLALKEMGNPIVARLEEFKRRDEGIDAFKRGVAQWQKLSEGRDPKYAHIDAAELGKIAQRCKDLLDWLDMSIQKMSKASLYDDPVFTYNELMTKANELEKFAKPILNKPVPKKEEPKKEEAKKEEKKADAGATAGAGAAGADATAAPAGAGAAPAGAAGADAGAAPVGADAAATQ